MTSNAENVATLERLIARRNERLLQHDYFRCCRQGMISRRQLIDIVEQLYCFSVFFERVLARRIAEYSSTGDEQVIALARGHMREEIGHAQMFRDCLVANGRSPAEIARIAPRLYTKAMFGYLIATIQHENEYVANVAIMQVMERIGFHFFTETLEVMRRHDMVADALERHADDDEGHAHLGLELAEHFDRATMADCERVIDDLYSLMALVLEEWLVPEDSRPTLRSAPGEQLTVS